MRITALSVVVVCALCQVGLAQRPTGVVLRIDLRDFVVYQIDISDPAKLATEPGIVRTAAPARPFASFESIADIVAVNGQPVKGTWVDRAGWVKVSPNAQPGGNGQAIGDTTRSPFVEWHCEIMQEDGTPVGSIAGIGLNGGSAPPGAPSGSIGGTWIVTGGTGAFLGMRGQGAFGQSSIAIDTRRSAVEDPANRRLNGGAALPLILHLIPMSRPEIVSTAAGPAVTHSNDFTLVSASKPAVAGEVLSLFATGLGPVRPGVDPGQPFPSNPLAAVNSPVQVMVNGKAVDLLGAVGYPGAVDGYQVNFRVPPDTQMGPATIQVSAAWIASAPVTIAVR